MSDGTAPLAFSCNVPSGSPATPGFVTSTQASQLKALPRTDPRWIRSVQRFMRDFETPNLTMLDGRSIEFWVFTDDANGNVFPSPLIRVTEGDLAQVTVKTSKGVHTIHHHGIEPDAFNDGVGHTSFEADDYTYQWQAHHAGTYFYHCHVNTTLHAQMGLFGPLVIDPDPFYDPAVPTGSRRLFRGGPVYKIANERIWAVYAADPRMHGLNHEAGLCGEDVGLNRFSPKYFMINNRDQKNGAITPQELAGTVPPPDRPPILDPKIAISAKQGETVLIRTIMAQYYPVTIQFGDDAHPLSASIWGSDGRPFRRTFSYKGENEVGDCVSVNGIVTHVMSPAERWDFLINTGDFPLGDYPITMLYSHWITGQPVGIAATQLSITAP